MKTVFQGIKDLFKLSWRTWLVSGLIGTILFVALAGWLGSNEYIGFIGVLLLIIGPLLPFIRFQELIKSKNIPIASMLIAHIIGVLLLTGIIFIFGLIYLLFGFSQ